MFETQKQLDNKKNRYKYKGSLLLVTLFSISLVLSIFSIIYNL